MKKITLALIGAIWVVALSNNAWAHSDLRVDLGVSGFGFSISDRSNGLSTFWFGNHQPYRNYWRPYPARPYLGWGGYRGQHYPRHHRHWGNHGHNHHGYNHHFKGHHDNYRHSDRHNGYRGNHKGYQRGGHQKRHWRR